MNCLQKSTPRETYDHYQKNPNSPWFHKKDYYNLHENINILAVSILSSLGLICLLVLERTNKNPPRSSETIINIALSILFGGSMLIAGKIVLPLSFVPSFSNESELKKLCKSIQEFTLKSFSHWQKGKSENILNACVKFGLLDQDTYTMMKSLSKRYCSIKNKINAQGSCENLKQEKLQMKQLWNELKPNMEKDLPYKLETQLEIL